MCEVMRGMYVTEGLSIGCEIYNITTNDKPNNK
jgi:hypothetical protein